MKRIHNLGESWDKTEKINDEEWERMQKYSWDNDDDDDTDELEHIATTPLNSECNHYGEPQNCNHTIQAWMHLNKKYEMYACINCIKIFEIRKR